MFQGFVDGDLIETFLDLGRDKMAEVAEQMKVKDAAGNLQKATVDDLIKIVEDLTRIH
jgi:DNA damage-binding protein 1